ncbi:helix-turn-helix domain-containing protein [Rhodococcus globerulus]|uniref:Helix-turn-helix domain-containing protein n=1 Tax=Rhodococcus globerulus TaxID=33008 RepID=A0ABU4C5D9_RHOGO|nr:helix-turn-helix domain-containing protein [Rhodococcus globerulus]MDV6271635.1 helix-turn-helix domain-containing protein [Rhodococcus globerulus]
MATEQTTFAMDAEPSEDGMHSEWMVQPPGRVVVARGVDGRVLDIANMYANHANQGARVASGSSWLPRPREVTVWAEVGRLYDSGEKAVAQIAALLDVSRTTVYGHLLNKRAPAAAVSVSADLVSTSAADSVVAVRMPRT